MDKTARHQRDLEDVTKVGKTAKQSSSPGFSSPANLCPSSSIPEFFLLLRLYCPFYSQGSSTPVVLLLLRLYCPFYSQGSSTPVVLLLLRLYCPFYSQGSSTPVVLLLLRLYCPFYSQGSSTPVVLLLLCLYCPSTLKAPSPCGTPAPPPLLPLLLSRILHPCGTPAPLPLLPFYSQGSFTLWYSCSSASTAPSTLKAPPPLWFSYFSNSTAPSTLKATEYSCSAAPSAFSPTAPFYSQVLLFFYAFHYSESFLLAPPPTLFSCSSASTAPSPLQTPPPM
ncbi:hypothetical protein GE061_003752 [Apolygus lucorum]|uniref:Uncharacterized protein n=1 Tax=Apolygus lucorum TaxID=248454 RepID=A0A8S9X4B4_APOLU|nr:hypothetical protein GE061_003752 [Apolygus lucorum]